MTEQKKVCINKIPIIDNTISTDSGSFSLAPPSYENSTEVTSIIDSKNSTCSDFACMNVNPLDLFLKFNPLVIKCDLESFDNIIGSFLAEWA